MEVNHFYLNFQFSPKDIFNFKFVKVFLLILVASFFIFLLKYCMKSIIEAKIRLFFGVTTEK